MSIAEEITYTEVGGYLIPNMVIPEMLEWPGKYGQMRLNHLKNHNEAIYVELVLNGTIHLHCQEINKEAEEQLDQMIPALLVKDPAPDKATNPIDWAAHMNSLQAQAEETILAELVYS